MTHQFSDGYDVPLHSRAGGDATGTKPLADALHDAKEAGMAFVREAYEHPKTTVIAAAGIAAGAVALYAGRNQIGRFLPGASKEVLLIEDTPYMGKALKSALESNGERVAWYTGVKSANPLTAVNLKGESTILDPRKFKVAFVDGDLKGSYLQGEHVVDALHRDGLRSIGTSSVPSINDMMLANGAHVAAPKATIVGGLANNQIDLTLARKAPGVLQHQLDDLTAGLKGEAGESLREKGNALLTKFIKEDAGL